MGKQLKGTQTYGMQGISAIFHDKGEHVNLTSIDKGGVKREREELREIWEDGKDFFFKRIK